MFARAEILPIRATIHRYLDYDVLMFREDEVYTVTIRKDRKEYIFEECSKALEFAIQCAVSKLSRCKALVLCDLELEKTLWIKHPWVELYIFGTVKPRDDFKPDTELVSKVGDKANSLIFVGIDPTTPIHHVELYCKLVDCEDRTITINSKVCGLRGINVENGVNKINIVAHIINVKGESDTGLDLPGRAVTLYDTLRAHVHVLCENVDSGVELFYSKFNMIVCDVIARNKVGVGVELADYSQFNDVLCRVWYTNIGIYMHAAISTTYATYMNIVHRAYVEGCNDAVQFYKYAKRNFVHNLAVKDCEYAVRETDPNVEANYVEIVYAENVVNLYSLQSNRSVVVDLQNPYNAIVYWHRDRDIFRLDYVYEYIGVNAKLVSNFDIEVTDPNRGIILTDRSTGIKYRLYVDNGTLNLEQV